MKKLKLEADFDYDFEIYGISSSVKLHKLCWSINQNMHLKLRKNDDLILYTSKGDTFPVINSGYVDDNFEITVFQNKSPEDEGQYIVPEATHFDYIVKLNGHFQSIALEEVINRLREVKYIEYIAEILKDKIKSKDNFIY